MDGYYKCTSTLLLPTRTYTILGDGAGQTAGGVCEFRFSQTDGNHCFEYQNLTDTADVLFAGPIFGGFSILGNSSTGDGVHWATNGTSQTEIKNIYVRSVGGYGFYFKDIFVCKIQGVRATLAEKSGCYLRGNSIEIQGGFDFNGEHGIEFFSCKNISFTGEVPQSGSNGTGDFWEATTAYSVNDIVKVNEGFVYRCTVAGTSGSTAPNARGEVVDGTVTWISIGIGDLAGISCHKVADSRFTFWHEASFTTRSDQ
jgi:hypothetical protein